MPNGYVLIKKIPPLSGGILGDICNKIIKTWCTLYYMLVFPIMQYENYKQKIEHLFSIILNWMRAQHAQIIRHT